MTIKWKHVCINTTSPKLSIFRGVLLSKQGLTRESIGSAEAHNGGVTEMLMDSLSNNFNTRSSHFKFIYIVFNISPNHIDPN